MSDSLQPYESQHAKPPCPSPSPGVHSNSCPSSWWCHPAISSVVPFSSYPQSLPASESFPTSQLFAWGGQSIGVSALASFLPKNTQDWFPSGKTKRWWVGELVFSTMSSCNTKFPFLQVPFTGMGVILNSIIRNDKIFSVLSFIFHRILSTCKLLSSCFSIFPLIFWNPVQWRHKGLRYLLS